MSTLYVALISIALSLAAQFLLKAGASSATVRAVLAEPVSLRSGFVILTEPHVFAGFVLYAIGAMIWLAVLSRWDVSKAYPLLGLGFVGTAVIGYLTGEQLSVARITGIALICAGVVLVGRS